MGLLKVGDKIPNFECLDDKGNIVKTQDLLSNKCIIFFYPKANTPGCTAQACNLSENFSELKKNGYSIYGVSADKVKSQSSFSTKFGGFPYPLLADVNMDVIKSSDWVIDLGPEGGDEGGEIITCGTPEMVAEDKKSYTGHFLKDMLK